MVTLNLLLTGTCTVIFCSDFLSSHILILKGVQPTYFISLAFIPSSSRTDDLSSALTFSPCYLSANLPRSSLTPTYGCPPQLLSPGQYYTIALELELPESPVNEEIGVFMVNITFYTTEGRFLSTSARPVRERKGETSFQFRH